MDKANNRNKQQITTSREKNNKSKLRMEWKKTKMRWNSIASDAIDFEIADRNRACEECARFNYNYYSVRSVWTSTVRRSVGGDAHLPISRLSIYSRMDPFDCIFLEWQTTLRSGSAHSCREMVREVNIYNLNFPNVCRAEYRANEVPKLRLNKRNHSRTLRIVRSIGNLLSLEM